MKSRHYHDTGVYIQAAGIGVIAGMRSMSAPAFVSNSFARVRPKHLRKSPFRHLSSPFVSNVLALLAAGEMIADKLPFMPNRTDPPALVGRALNGAFAAAAWAAYNRQSALIGAVTGAAAAIASSFAFFHLRRAATHELEIPDSVAAITEDALVLGTGIGLLYDLD